MSAYAIPANFMMRRQDLLFLRKAPVVLGVSKLEAKALMFSIWHNFGIDREGKLLVTAERSAWPSDDGVGVLESFVDWAGPPGRLVSFAVDVGFLELVEAEADRSRLVASGFSEVNRKPLSSASLSQLGGINKSRNHAAREAAMGAREQMDLFRKTGDPILREYDPSRLQSALVFIRQIAKILHWVEPADPAFLNQLVPQALQALDGLGDDRDLLLSWLVTMRGDDSLPSRMDLLLRSIPDLSAKAKEWRKSL
jgi:hypothetical protein